MTFEALSTRLPQDGYTPPVNDHGLAAALAIAILFYITPHLLAVLYTWWTGASKLRTTLHPNCKLITSVDGYGREEKGTYILVEVVNVGYRSVTITNASLAYYTSLWRAALGLSPVLEASPVDFTQSKPLPLCVPPGKNWVGKIAQDKDTEARAENGYMFVVLHDAKGVRRRTRLKLEVRATRMAVC